MKKFIFPLLFLIGCMPFKPVQGLITSKSEFDGSVQISTQPSWVCKDQGRYCAILFELYKTSKMEQGKAVLRVYASTIVQSRALPPKISIDGEVIELHPIDAVADIVPSVYAAGFMALAYGGPWSIMRYDIDMAMIKRLVSANRVVVQVTDGSISVEGVFTEASPSKHDEWYARSAFKEFYNKVTSVEL